jgi:hypothetical protein
MPFENVFEAAKFGSNTFTRLTRDMFADISTKALASEAFVKCRSRLGVLALCRKWNPQPLHLPYVRNHVLTLKPISFLRGYAQYSGPLEYRGLMSRAPPESMSATIESSSATGG